MTTATAMYAVRLNGYEDQDIAHLLTVILQDSRVLLSETDRVILAEAARRLKV